MTEAAAMAAARHAGRGDKERVDQAAVDAMRPALSSIAMDGIVVIGEGEKDEAPMLYNGEHVGAGGDPRVDVAVDPVDGTTLTAKNLPDALAVIALSERGTMFDPGPCVYMEKLVVGQGRRGRGRPRRADRGQSRPDRPRQGPPCVGSDRRDPRPPAASGAHRADPDDGREDQVPARRRCRRGDHAASEENSVDVLVGVGGTPEGVIAACALKCIDGEIFGRLRPRDERERAAAVEAGYDVDRILTTSDLVWGEDIFFAATGVTDGELLRGVRLRPPYVLTRSLSMRSRSRAPSGRSTARHHAAKSNLIQAQ